MKNLTICLVLTVLNTTHLQAEVLNSHLKVAAGYWVEFSRESAKNNQGDKSVAMVEYRVKTDWGSSVVRGLIENIGGTNKSPNGLKITSIKTFSTTYIDINESPFSIWLDHQTVSNTKISDNHLRAGFSYHTNLGPIKFRTSMGPEYYFGHSPFDDANGVHWFGRTVFSYQFTHNIKQAFIFDNVNFRNSNVQNAIGWQKNGYHTMLVTHIGITTNLSASIQLHHFSAFGGYKTHGNSALVSLSYNL